MPRFPGPALVASLLLLSALAAAPDVSAQSESGAQSTFIPASIEGAAMGQSGVALFWCDDAVDWANPALLSARRGLRLEMGKTRLVPDLASGVYFRSRRIAIGYGGIGIDIAGKPVEGIGIDRLDYGKSVATDVDGNPIGEFDSFETIRSIGVGVGVVQTVETIGSLFGIRGDPVSRYGDVSLGHATKRILVDLAPAYVQLSGQAARGEVTEKDRGLWVRLTPYDAIGHPGALPGIERSTRLRLDLAYGASQRNYGEDSISYIAGLADPVSEEDRKGWSARVGATVPLQVEQGWRDEGRSWVADLFLPIFAFGITREETRYRVDRSSPYESKITRSGWEVTALNLFSYRRGHIDDPTGLIQDDTRGYGLRLEYAHWIGIRYDHASVPQSKYLKQRVERNGIVAFFDPVEAWKRLH
ncbi:MAG: hypothetical protein ACM3JJ_11115 [Hyphomicrobiales bacterium]